MLVQAQPYVHLNRGVSIQFRSVCRNICEGVGEISRSTRTAGPVGPVFGLQDQARLLLGDRLTEMLLPPSKFKKNRCFCRATNVRSNSTARASARRASVFRSWKELLWINVVKSGIHVPLESVNRCLLFYGAVDENLSSFLWP